MDNKTIYALSTVFGKSGVAIIRISGKNAFDVFDKMTEIKSKDVEARKLYYTKIFDSVSHETLDNCMIVGFPSPFSFTGENIVEINCHGSKAVIRSLINSLSAINGFRLAEPGEFSRRAFYNGKMDLTEADGLADLIDAETSLQQKIALRQVGGNLFDLYASWRDCLVSVLSHIEAYIDFPDEDIPESVVRDVENSVFKIADEIKKHLESSDVEERLRDGFNVVIAGPTNAGKSSLINAITKRNVAIVSDIAGTTRDVVEAYVDIKGFPIIFSDTAGLRTTSDEIEKIGIKLAEEKIVNADFKIFMFDANVDNPEIFAKYIDNSDNFMLVANKMDKMDEELIAKMKSKGCFLISAKDNNSVAAIVDAIYNYFNNKFMQNESHVITRHRYKEALLECLDCLGNFSLQKDIELSAEDIRLACRSIGKITGQVAVDEILDKIFSSFCIGK